MIHRWANLSDCEPLCQDGDTFEFCNFAQDAPWTEICEGRTGLTFRHCNLSNCRVPEDSVIEHCQDVQVDIDRLVERVNVDGAIFDITENIVVYAT